LAVRPCRYCGKEFAPQRGTAKTCSMRCRDALKVAEKTRDGESRCAKCRQWKPVDQFVRSGRRPGGAIRYHSYCKPCNAEWFVPTERRKRLYREAFILAPEVKAANKRESNQRQHHKRRAAGQPPTRDQLDALYCAQGARCAYCGVGLPGSPHVDHKTPVSKGGTNAIENLHFTCPTCNLRKGAMTHEEFLVSKRRPVWREHG
jgi:5-methylcytosine-specific restriction endonuclease McrA